MRGILAPLSMLCFGLGYLWILLPNARGCLHDVITETEVLVIKNKKEDFMNNKNNFVLAIDQGTTSSRTIIFNSDYNIVAQTQEEFTQHFPNSGWVEHDPLEIWQHAKYSQASPFRANLDADDIAAIGITNQRETTIIWDRELANLSTTPLFGKTVALLKCVKN